MGGRATSATPPTAAKTAAHATRWYGTGAATCATDASATITHGLAASQQQQQQQ